MNWYLTQRTFSDRFIPLAKALIGITEVQVASDHLDRTEAADLVVTCPSGKQQTHYAFRVRSFHQLKYSNQFTLRCKSQYGGETEFSKVIRGCGDRLFYGFSNQAKDGFEKWLIADFHVFRCWAEEQSKIGRKFRSIPNKKDPTEFYAFNLGEMPSDFIIKSGGPFVMTQHDSFYSTAQSETATYQCDANMFETMTGKPALQLKMKFDY